MFWPFNRKKKTEVNPLPPKLEAPVEPQVKFNPSFPYQYPTSAAAQVTFSDNSWQRTNYFTPGNTEATFTIGEPKYVRDETPTVDPMAGASEKLASRTAQYCTDNIGISLARKLFRGRPLNAGERLFVPKPAQATAYIIGSEKDQRAYTTPIRGALPQIVDMTELDEVEGNMFEIAIHPTEKDTVLAKDLDGRIDRMKVVLFDALRKEEDTNTLKLCQAAIYDFEDNLVKSFSVNRQSMLDGYAAVENEGYRVTHVVIHLKHVREIRDIEGFVDYEIDKVRATGAWGNLWGAEVVASNRQDIDFVTFVAAGQIGEVGYRKYGFSGKAAPKVEKLRQGAVISEEVGMVLNNPRARTERHRRASPTRSSCSATAATTAWASGRCGPTAAVATRWRLRHSQKRWRSGSPTATSFCSPATATTNASPCPASGTSPRSCGACRTPRASNGRPVSRRSTSSRAASPATASTRGASAVLARSGKPSRRTARGARPRPRRGD